jgi:redox-sensitive bicupin YhaK (pirin superfamily)
VTLEARIQGRVRELGGFSVRRVLPAPSQRLVGPFIFFDHFGPLRFEPGAGLDVRPHPHIALATISYLFDGEILHRDSLGSHQPIRPGDVNWMIAGRGIVHSERTAPELRRSGSALHGIQTWVALPTEHEEHEPLFEHHPVAALPVLKRGGVELRVIAGTAFGLRAPTAVLSPTLYVHARFSAGSTLSLDAEHPRRAAYVASGRLEFGSSSHAEGELLVFAPGASIELRAEVAADVMLIGGAPLDGERHIEWNFVSSSLDRIARAKQDWREGRFAKVPGDELEFIPLP